MNYIIIGCGISGAVIARKLAEVGNNITIYERRNHIAGNMYDFVDEHGFLVQQYGPHIFHTSDEDVYQFVETYGNWNDFKLICGAVWDGKYTPSPFNFTTIDTFFESDKAEKIKQAIRKAFPNQEVATVVELLEHEDALVREFAVYLFENDYAPYTAKQWGMSANEVNPSVLKRVPVRLSYDTGYFSDKYEMMPAKSFTDFVSNIINHPNIEVCLNVEAKDHIAFNGNKILWDGSNKSTVVYTGPIDELFEGKYGSLPYRSLHFEWKYSEEDAIQYAPVVAYPKEDGFTRITEYKKLPVQIGRGTSYALEFPQHYIEGEKNEPYYPVLTEESQKQYAKYKETADSIDNLVLCGRLADFKYYNMDQVIKNALNISEQLCL